jgi:Rrf2 family protein
MISQTAEYALRAAACLGRAAGEPMTTQAIAAETRVPVGYLAKVLQALGRAGIVAGRRGLHGGYALARPAAELTALEVINAVDPLRRIACCPLGLPEHAGRLCPLHERLDAAIALLEAHFTATTIDDLLAQADDASGSSWTATEQSPGIAAPRLDLSSLRHGHVPPSGRVAKEPDKDGVKGRYGR